MATFNRTDIEFILQQILMAEAGQPPVNPHLSFGLRELTGTNNNAVPGQSTFGSADQPFPTLTTPFFQTVTVNIDGTPFDPHPSAAGDMLTTSYASTIPGAPQAFGVNVIDSAPRTISNLISDLSINNPAALDAAQVFGAQLGAGYAVASSNPSGITLPGADGVFGTGDDVLPADPNNLFIGNITPDSGLSAPFNNWMTFFGQFFDHGLDMISKGGNGLVFIPLQPDDPLYVPGGHTNFMVLNRATNLPGPDGIIGTADDIHQHINQTSPFIDQNQTYGSEGSHNAFLREYIIGADGRLHTTGKMLQHTTGAGADGIQGDNPFTANDESADDVRSGMGTWADLKANALKFGLAIVDTDVGNIPLLATNPYGDYLPGPNGHVQVVVSIAGVTTLVELDPQAPQTLAQIAANSGGTILYTGHAFINDMAQSASPVNGQTGAPLAADADAVAGGQPAAGQYDNELLDAHYVAGDGRVNENIALITVHSIFHDEHNRLLEQVKAIVRAELAKGDTSFATNWVLPGTNLSNGIQENEWNGERLMQVAKFGTETQYQHLVFEEFARKIAPTIHLFGNVDIHLNPAITSEFANAVYRFGHSMLDENVPLFQLNADGTMAMDANGQPILTNMGLIEAFTNPLAFANLGASGAAQIVQGATHQIGSEIDEFVTGALRNNLLGLPLDLAALNIARGRDTGVPPLNLVRAEIYAATNDQTLKPYASWTEFRQFLKHDLSIVNFLAAYGTHASILAATTSADKRAAALALVQAGDNPANADAYDFMHSLGAYANDVNSPVAVHAQWSTGSVTGLDTIDLWIGGLAEKQNLFGGLLGSTFNFIFETQLESLQDADRLYYLPRIEGMHWGTEIEANSFASMIMLNTGAKHLPASIFLTPEYTVEARDYFQQDANGNFILDANGHRIATDPATWLHNPATGAALVEVLPDGTVHFLGDDNFFGNTMVLGGTEGDDRLQAGHADDDTVWGDGGNDWIDGGNGNDQLFGGDGADTIVDSGGNDIIHGDAGNDTIQGGTGDDIVFGGDGDDYIETGLATLGDEAQGGLGNDIIKGGDSDDTLLGNEGDDWIEGGAGGDIVVGDEGAPTGQVPLFAANDVLDGGVGGDLMLGFSGDDIMLGLGGFDTFDGRLGYDWADFEQETQAVSADMSRAVFIANAGAPGGDAIRDVYVETEGISGSRFDDVLLGSNPNTLDPLFNGLTNVNLIFGLSSFFPLGPVNFSGGNIMLGGEGSDTIMGRGGNDIIDGDAWLHVSLDGSGQAGSNIVREILFDITPGEVDVAVYNDVFQNYTISGPDAQGFYLISHNLVSKDLGITNEGVDRVRNIERLQFLDRTVLLDQSPNANQLPTGTITVTDATNLAVATPVVGSELSFVSTVNDPNGIAPGTLAYQWQYLDPAAAGGGRPVWVNIAGATNTTFTPTNFFLGVPLRVMATFVDGLGLTEHVVSAQTNLVIEPTNINTAPFVVQQQGLVGLPDTAARSGLPINLFLPVTTVFRDNETPSNLLNYTATLDNGAALSTVGLTFSLLPDGAGGVLGAAITGMVANVGPIAITVRATDTPPLGAPPTPLAVTDTFILNVLQGNYPPSTAAAPEHYIGLEDTAVSGTLLPGTDPEGVTPIFRLVLGSESNGAVTAFNQVTGAFSFTGSLDYAGPASFSYTVFDGQLNSAAKTVTFDLAPVNDGTAPFTITGVAAVGQTITALIGVDPDGPWDPITVSYQWYRDGVAYGAPTNSPDYVVTAADIGHALSAHADYFDGQGIAESVDTATSAQIGVLAVEAIPGSSNAIVRALNTLTDPDGNPNAGVLFYDWLVSSDGVTYTGADYPAVSLNTRTLTFAANTTQYVFTAAFWIDGAGNFNTASSDVVRVLVGSVVDDSIVGNAGNDIFFGLGGNDLIYSGGGNDTLVGGADADALNGDAGDDTFLYTIGDGADVIAASAGFDTLVITGLANGEFLNVATDATGAVTSLLDLTVAGLESYVVDLAAGVDTLSYAANTDSVSIDLGGGTATGFTSIAHIENAIGGAGADSIAGDDSANSLDGGAGADALFGARGNDTLRGGDGDDLLSGDAGNDLLNGGAGTDTAIFSGNFADYIFKAHPQGGLLLVDKRGIDSSASGDRLLNIEQLQFGDMIMAVVNEAPTGAPAILELLFREGETLTADTSSIADANGLTAAVFSFQWQQSDDGGVTWTDIVGATAASFTPGQDQVLSQLRVRVDYIDDASFAETIYSDPTPNVGDLIIGDITDDTLLGTDFTDRLVGLDGTDTLDGGIGADVMEGGLGDDTYFVDDLADVVVENLDEGLDTIITSLNDQLIAANAENMTFAGFGDFFVLGNELNNVIIAGAGADLMEGDAGDDTLFGDDGNDAISGGLGADTIFGGLGFDSIDGGAGDDTIDAGDDDDVITYLAGDGADTVDGGAGNDTLEIIGGAGAQTLSAVYDGAALTAIAGGNVGNVETFNIDLGADDDTLSYAGSAAAIAVDLSINSASGFVLVTGIENATGGDGNDALTGDAGANALNGGAGDDTLIGGAGADTLSGGAGADSIDAGDDDDVINYAIGDGVDTVNGGTGSDTLAIVGGAGAQSLNVLFDGSALTAINGGTVSNVEFVTIDLGADDDTLSYAGSTAAVAVDLGAGAASGFASIAGVESLRGGAGNDTLTGDALANVIIGGAGNDTLDGGSAGADSLRGSGGDDTYIVDHAGVAIVEFANDGADSILTSLSSYTINVSVENLTFTGAGDFTGVGNLLNNVMSGGDGNDTLSGGGGNDTLNGGLGADTLTGGAGADLVNGGDGADIINYAINDGADTIDGGIGIGVDVLNVTATAFADTLLVKYNGSSISVAGAAHVANVEAVNVDLGGGFDTLSFRDSTVSVTANLSTSTASGIASIAGVESLTGSAGADTLTGNDGANVLIGGAGNDTLDGGIAGGDSLRGGSGDDSFVIDHTGIVVTEFAGEGVDTVLTTLASYTLTANVENLTFTGSGSFGGAGNILDNVITGGTGANTLAGNGGNDTLIGGASADTLAGNAGDDTLNGGGGDDAMNGGIGNDAFVFAASFGHDTITGFDANATDGQDMLDISALGITAADFASRVVITDLGASTLLTIDGINQITLLGVTGDGLNVITQSDFILGGP